MSTTSWPHWRDALPKDLLASVVVFLVALPLCMGIAIASGLPPAAGLVTGIIGGLVVGALAGSPLQVSGPAAGLAVIVFQLVQEFGVAALGTIVLLAGVLQLLAGLFKVGQLFRAVSPAVIHGMLGGIGVLIFASQFHVMLDDSPKGSGIANLLSIPAAIAKGVFPVDGSTHHQAAAIGLVTIVTLVLWLRFSPTKFKRVPAHLVAVVAAVAVAQALAMAIKFVSVPDNLLAALTFPTADSLSALKDPDILKAAVALAFIASAETLLCATAIDQKHDGPRTNYDRELVAQGIGNAICGSVGALPLTGVIVRSAANVEAGALTRNSAILHGAWILLLVTIAPFVLAAIPVAALAAILVYTGFKLVNIPQMKKLWSHGRAEFGIYALTLVSIVFANLLTGVIIGFAASVAKLLYTLTHLKLTTTRDAEVHHLHVEGAATFLRLPALATALEAIPRSAELRVHINHASFVDHAALESIASWERQAERAGGRLVLEWAEILQLSRGTRPVSPATSVRQGVSLAV
jgi:MFS superfamily sulfate permease-like transporter